MTGVQRTPRHRGFTLVELLVVIGIIILLVAVAIPTLSMLRGTVLEEAGRMFQRVATMTRNLARQRGKPHRLVLFTSQVRGGEAIGLRIYQDGRDVPVEGATYYLPDRVKPDSIDANTLSGCRLHVFTGEPDATAVWAAAGNFLQYEADGKLDLDYFANDVAPALDGGKEIYDPDSKLRAFSDALVFDVRIYSMNEDQAMLLDISPTDGQVRFCILTKGAGGGN